MSLTRVFRVVRSIAGLGLSSAVWGGCAYVYPVPATGAGCSGLSATYFPAADVVRIVAAEDLECAPEGLTVEHEGETTLRASGCGRSLRYACEDDAVSGCSVEDAAERGSCRPLTVGEHAGTPSPTMVQRPGERRGWSGEGDRWRATSSSCPIWAGRS